MHFDIVISSMISRRALSTRVDHYIPESKAPFSQTFSFVLHAPCYLKPRHLIRIEVVIPQASSKLTVVLEKRIVASLGTNPLYHGETERWLLKAILRIATGLLKFDTSGKIAN